MVWVVVASKYGSTREVGEAITDELGHARAVEVRDAAEAESFEGADASCSGAPSTAPLARCRDRRDIEARAEGIAKALGRSPRG